MMDMHQLGERLGLSGAAHQAPEYQIMLGGKDISPTLRRRLISMTITDKRGFEADTIEITLDDSDGQLDIPARGVTITAMIGWQGEQLVNKGTYKIDEVEHTGAPDVMTIRGKSADLTADLNRLRERSFHKATLGTIVDTIAKGASLKPVCAAALKGQLIDHIDQAKESDLSFLTRLGAQCGGVPTIKQGRLLMLQAGSGKTSTGIDMPAITITRADGDQHSFSVADRDAYTGVTATWHDTKKATTHTTTSKRKKRKTTKPKAVASTVPDGVTVKKDDREVLAGEEGNIKALRHVYASQRNAIRAAMTEWSKIQRGVATFELELAKGRPELVPEMTITVSGFKAAIDAAKWIPTEAVHTLTNGGYTNHIRMEVKIDELPDVDEG